VKTKSGRRSKVGLLDDRQRQDCQVSLQIVIRTGAIRVATTSALYSIADLERHCAAISADRTASPSPALEVNTSLRLSVSAPKHREGDAAATGLPSPSELPSKLSSFVGRQRELTEMRHRLEIARLVSLVGTGGIGKTRLALEVARGHRSRYVDGVIFADLAPLATPELVVQTVARSLGLRVELDREPLAAIVSFLAPRQLLLVLDNCEHLVEACAELVTALLQNCPHVSVLATSREPLGVDGEMQSRLGPLDEQAGIDLLVDRARAQSADFASGDGTVLRQLCQALDCLPLAIELAAARTSMLTPSEILDRLTDRFALLARATARGGEARHQTLRATVDWSYELLEPSESRLFRRLGVFSGLFDLAGATAMGGPDTLDVLDRLVDKSLVVARTTESSTRYRLLDTLRQYAWDRLHEAGEVELARSSHLHYFLARAESLFTPSDSVDGPSRELDGQLDDLRSAFEWCLQADPQAGLRLIGVTRDVWWRRSCAEGRRWARAFLERCPEPTLARAHALTTAALVEVLSNPAEAQRLLRQARALAARLDQRTLAVVDYRLGFAAFVDGRMDRATRHLERALSVMERLGDQHGCVIVHIILGWTLLPDHGRREEARNRLERALKQATKLSDRYAAGSAEYGLGLYWRWSGHPGRALAHFRSVLDTTRALEIVPTTAATLLHVARLLAPGEPIRGARLAGAGLAAAKRGGVQLPPRLLQSLDQLRSELGQRLGDGQASRAWTDGELLTMDEAIALALEPARPDDLRRGGLSSRELEVTQLVARGLSSPEIGDLLHLSPRTVDNHLARIYAKLGFSSRLQLTSWYVQTASVE
jgi:non-specific serine/threonine protein kinase